MHILLLALIMFLTACTGTNTTQDSQSNSKKTGLSSIYDRYKFKNHRYLQPQDGAPVQNKYVSFKEPVPTNEPLSRYGNPTEYRVSGQKYEVKQRASGYKERGIASWYGTKFHKQRTSSGEPYNMYVMTAAHKTLPLPSYVKVKNLENGKEAIVRVNDRGPFHANRVIDLSYAAALKLGVFPKGTARVEIETLKGPAGLVRYYLQAGAFRSAQSAQQLKSKLVKFTSSPVFVEHFGPNYIVKVGPFRDKNSSDNLKTKLARNGLKGAFSVLI